MKVIVSHPHGNRFTRALISSLELKGMLIEFNTTLSIDADASWLKFLPANVRQELLRRTYPLSTDKIHTFAFKEWVRLISPRLGLKMLSKPGTGWASVDSVYNSFDDAVSKRLQTLARTQDIDAVYAYEDGALSSFKEAKRLGLKCIYDLPIAYWETGRMLMTEESERLPKWAVTLGGGIRDSKEKLDRKVKELELADLVVVPSTFVRDSLPLWMKNKKIVMVPFGTPINGNEREATRKVEIEKRPLRVLFAGSMGQRKGLGDLFEAMKGLNRKDVELVVMGSLLAPMDFYRSEFNDFTYEPGRPHDQVLALMRSCDIFCLPSIVEGRALVMQEAMSQGLPVILTPNTGGSDLVIEGETGFLVAIRSPEMIKNRIEWFLENRAKIPEMGELAKKHAETYSWSNYSLSIINSIVNL